MRHAPLAVHSAIRDGHIPRLCPCVELFTIDWLTVEALTLHFRPVLITRRYENREASKANRSISAIVGRTIILQTRGILDVDPNT